MSITGLLPKFEGKLFSVTEVKKGKPAPDVFPYAARKFAISPTACAVVEDTPTGVSAGMSVYGYSALTPAHHLKDVGAHYIFNNMSELPLLLLEGTHGG